MLIVSIFICFLFVGLYEVKLWEIFRGIIRRIFVSVGFSYFLVEILSWVFFDKLVMDLYFLLVVVGLIIIIFVVFRYFIYCFGLLGLGKVRIVVFGVGEWVFIIEKCMCWDVDRIGFEFVGFIFIFGDNCEDGICKEKIIYVKVDESFLWFIIENDIEEIVIVCD